MHVKHWLPLLVLTITVPDDAYLVAIPRACAEDAPYVSSGTVAVPAVSTGPYTLKSASGDCWKLPGVNNNGTITKTPMDWTRCP